MSFMHGYAIRLKRPNDHSVRIVETLSSSVKLVWFWPGSDSGCSGSGSGSGSGSTEYDSIPIYPGPWSCYLDS